MKPKSKLSQIELLNFEGAVLIATKIKHRILGDIYVIQDEWRHVIAIFTHLEFSNFLSGGFEVVDSNGKSWNYANEHPDAKPTDENLKTFFEGIIGSPTKNIRHEIKSRTAEIIEDIDKKRPWLSETQMLNASLLFWMGEKNISKKEVEDRLGMTDQELKEAFSGKTKMPSELKRKIKKLINE